MSHYSHKLWRALALALIMGLGLVALGTRNVSATINPLEIIGEVGVASIDPSASAGTWYLRYTGNPAPTGYSHAYQWAEPQIVCSPDDIPTTFDGTLDVTNMSNGDVAFIGLLDKGLMGTGSTGYQSGAYIYVYKQNATTLRIGPSDGNKNGEIIQIFQNVTIPVDNTLNVTLNIDGAADPNSCASGAVGNGVGCITVTVENQTPMTDSYGDVKSLNNAVTYSHHEFEHGAYPGWDDYGTANIQYDLEVTGCSVIQTVRPADMSLTPLATDWHIAWIEGSPTYSIVSGPATPPLGTASLQMTTGGTADKVYIMNYDHAGVKLADITTLGYSTYGDSNLLAPVLQLQIDPDGTGPGVPKLGGGTTNFATVSFEPYFANIVTSGVWQTWDVLTGGASVWASNVAGDTGNGNNGTQNNPATWAEFVAFYPDATISGGFGVNVGKGWTPSFMGHVDALQIGYGSNMVTYDFEPDLDPCTTVCYADAVNGNDANSGSTPHYAKKTIQAAVNQVSAGGTVYALPGAYPENPVVNKSLMLVSTDGRDNTTIQLQGSSGSMKIQAPDVTVKGFTVAASPASCPTATQSNIYVYHAADNASIVNNRIKVGDGCGAADYGVGIITITSADATPPISKMLVGDNIFEPLATAGTRAFYINPSVGVFTFRGNTITGEFKSVALSEAQSSLIEDNVVMGTGSSAGLALWGQRGAGVWGTGTFIGNDISGTANAISLYDTETVTVTHNILDGNGNGVRVLNYALAAFDQSTIHINNNALTNNTGEGILNMLDPLNFGMVDGTCNWWGASSGPGPVGLGSGDKVSQYVDFSTILATNNLDGPCVPPPLCTTVCYADAVNGNDVTGTGYWGYPFKTIQKAIDTVQAGGEVRVLPGTYNETAASRDVLGIGNYQFGLFFEETAKDGVTLTGVTAGDVEITDPTATLAVIETNATNSFGYSGIFVEADNVTISGLEIGPNTPSDNKTIEVIGDGFTFKNSFMNVPSGGSLYFGDWRFDDGTDTSYIKSYIVDNNVFSDGSSVDITSGAGYSGATGNKLITNNQFEFSEMMYNTYGASWPYISFTGDSTTVPWFTYPMTGATITGNTFTNNAPDGIHIRARGIVDDSTFDWVSYWNNNTFNKAVITGPNLFNDVRSYNYACGSYSCNDVRQIGAVIQREIDHALDGDTVLVKSGTYPELVDVYKSVHLIGDGAATTTIQATPAVGSNNEKAVIQVRDGKSAEITGFTIAGPGFDTCGSILTGIFVREGATANIHDNTITAIQDNTGASTCQNGFGIFVGRKLVSTTGTATITNNTLTGYQKGGIIVDNTGSNATLSNNIITGSGSNNHVAQNGVQISRGATATFTGNDISLHQFSGSTWIATGVLLYDAGNVTINNNNLIHDNGYGIYIRSTGARSSEADGPQPVPFDAEFDDLMNQGRSADAITAGTMVINDNQFYGNMVYGAYVTGMSGVNGQCNWWGSAGGPSGGNKVSGGITVNPFRTSNNMGETCNIVRLGDSGTAKWTLFLPITR